MSKYIPGESLLYSAGFVSPEAAEAAAKRKQAEQDFQDSLFIGNAVPALTENDVIEGRPRWRTITALRADALAAKEAEERARRKEMECPELIITPEPIL